MSYGRGYGSRGISLGFTGPKPIEASKEYDIDITEIDRNENGIARVQGFMVFVTNGKMENGIEIKDSSQSGRKQICNGNGNYRSLSKQVA